MSEPFREEITRLEALYVGNPGGRVFTHLAEAYRKAGEPDRARDILDRGLRYHGDYASAYVVLGRVLMDMGQSDEARAAFRRVIELDRHNLIALRSLGDIAIEAGNTPEALRHYRELLALDPTDEFLQATVARLESSGPATESVEPAPSSEAEDRDVAAEVPGADGEAARRGVDDDDAVAQPDELVTETMAELYAAQGLHVRAAEVYRSLLGARPGDDRLEERLRQMESLIDGADDGAAGPAIWAAAESDAASASPAVSAAAESDAASPAEDTPGWLERVESAWTGGSGVAGAGPTPYAWTETAQTVRHEEADGEDRPISAYFESLLAWRPAERRSDQWADERAEVESRDTAVDADAEANEPAVWLDEAASDPVRSEAEPVDDAGTALTPGDVRPHPTRHASRGDPGRAGTPAVEEDEDLEMFRSWLQSLKK